MIPSLNSIYTHSASQTHCYTTLGSSSFYLLMYTYPCWLLV